MPGRKPGRACNACNAPASGAPPPAAHPPACRSAGAAQLLYTLGQTMIRHSKLQVLGGSYSSTAACRQMPADAGVCQLIIRECLRQWCKTNAPHYVAMCPGIGRRRSAQPAGAAPGGRARWVGQAQQRLPLLSWEPALLSRLPLLWRLACSGVRLPQPARCQRPVLPAPRRCRLLMHSGAEQGGAGPVRWGAHQGQGGVPTVPGAG